MKLFTRFVVFLFGIVLLLASCGKAPFVSMNGPSNFNFNCKGGTETFEIASNRDWSVKSSESWITVSPSSGAATDVEITVTVTCAPNTTDKSRTAKITLKAETFTETISVEQDPWVEEEPFL